MVDKLNQDLKQAMLDRNSLKVETLRMLISEVKNSQIQKGEEKLSDQDVVSIVRKEVKKRNEAAESFKSAGREEQAQKELEEAEILKTYLPQELSDEELTKIVEDTIKELGATTPADMGKVIGSILAKTQGQVDGSRVSMVVKERLVG